MAQGGPALAAAVLLACYIVGAVPVGVLVARRHGVDIRKHGSGNIGFTNVARVLGWRPGLLVFGLDIAKGAISMAVTRALWQHADPWLSVAGGLLAVLGHNYSVFLGFHGGKGIAASLGASLVLVWPAGLMALAVFIATVAVSRYVSLGSILAACSQPLFAALLLADRAPAHVQGLLCVLAVLAVAQHRDNIRRLLRGTENRIGRRAP